MLFVTSSSEFFTTVSRSTANLLIVISDRFARVLKTCGATQAVVLDISQSESAMLVFLANLIDMDLSKDFVSF